MEKLEKKTNGWMDTRVEPVQKTIIAVNVLNFIMVLSTILNAPGGQYQKSLYWPDTK